MGGESRKKEKGGEGFKNKQVLLIKDNKIDAETVSSSLYGEDDNLTLIVNQCIILSEYSDDWAYTPWKGDESRNE